ncbi:MAG: hypothetical protein IJW59_03515 [Clostridia bacterium]|nr:hypothetical protein [Clostridia bacterium]
MSKIKFYKLSKQVPKGKTIESINNESTEDIKSRLAKQAELAKEQCKTRIESKDIVVFEQEQEPEL